MPRRNAPQKVTTYTFPYEPHAGQLECHKHPARFRVINCGRRWGKTFFIPTEVYQCLKDALPMMKPKEIPRAWIIAPTYPLVEENWKAALQIYGDIILDRNIAEKWMLVYLDEGRAGLIEFKSAERGDSGLRGAGLVCAALDEASRIPREAWEYGIRPALAIHRGRAIFCSTPAGRNWYYEVWKQGQEADHQGQDDTQTEWKSWSFPSISNPYFPKDEWDSLNKTTPQMIWKQEFLAEFLEDSSSVFHNLDNIEGGALSQSPEPGKRYSIGVDLARTVDWTVLTVMDNDGQVVAVYRGKELEWSLQRKQIAAFQRRYAPSRVIMDSSGVGDPIEQDLRKAGIPVLGYKTNSAMVKSELIEGLQVAIEHSWIKLPAQRQNPELMFAWEELKAYGIEMLESGNIRYKAPEGHHDDFVMSLALATKGFENVLGRIKTQKKEDTGTTWKDYHRISDRKRPNIKYIGGQPYQEAIRVGG